MDVEVICTETVKPSNPTPDHLRSLNFSLFSNVGVPILMPMIFFYSNQNEPTLFSTLKTSLAESLTLFYPLAGRIEMTSSRVNCNDAGVPFVQAEAKTTELSKVIGNAEMADLDKLLPGGYQGFTDVILVVQVTVFACGVVIGVLMNSKCTDAFSLLMFVKTWASITSTLRNNINSNSGEIPFPFPRPCFDIATIFPPLPPSSSVFAQPGNLKSKPMPDLFKERPVSKRYVFDRNKLVALQSKLDVTNSSRKKTSLVLILSQIILKCVQKYRPNIPHEAFHLVNVRPRMLNPLSPEKSYYFGKMAVRAIAEQTGINEAEFLDQMNDSISKIDGYLVNGMQGRDGAEKFVSKLIGHSQRAMGGEIASLGFSSLRSLPVYEPDFGWGKPVWVTCATLALPNFIIFMPTIHGDEFEVYITLSAEAMAKLENDMELNSFIISANNNPASKL